MMSNTLDGPATHAPSSVATAHRPLVTVVLPTYQRRDLLERAIDSVQRQTYPNWELVVSDDEPGEGRTWQYLMRLAEEDARIRPVKNDGPNGQAANTNNAFDHARGEWIKLLHDDDMLKPHCLQELVDVAGAYRDTGDIRVITCGVERYINGRLYPSRRRSGWPLVELIPQHQIHVTMYMAEDAGGAAPSQKMIHRSVLEEGVRMEKPEGLRMLVDSWFNANVARHGDMLIYRKDLVEWHQGAHESETERWGDAIEEELYHFRDMLWPLVQDQTALPAPERMKQMIKVQRGLWRVRQGQFQKGLRLLAEVRDPGALLEYGRWIWHNMSKGRYARGKRIPLAE